MKHLLTILAALSLAGVANAQTPGPEDLAAIGNNLGPTVNALASGLGNTAEVLLTTQSAVGTSAALGTTVVNTANAALNGAPNLGSLSLLVLVNNLTAQQILNPTLTAIDDPTTANIQAALAPEDLTTIAKNLETTPHALLEGADFGLNGNGVRSGLVNILQGDITEPGDGNSSEYALRDFSNAVAFAGQELVQGTNLAPLGLAFGVNAIGVETALTPVLEPIQDPSKQFAEAGAPLTDPIVGILEAGF